MSKYNQYSYFFVSLTDYIYSCDKTKKYSMYMYVANLKTVFPPKKKKKIMHHTNTQFFKTNFAVLYLWMTK